MEMKQNSLSVKSLIIAILPMKRSFADLGVLFLEMKVVRWLVLSAVVCSIQEFAESLQHRLH